MHVTCDRCSYTWAEQPLAEGEERFMNSYIATPVERDIDYKP